MKKVSQPEGQFRDENSLLIWIHSVALKISVDPDQLSLSGFMFPKEGIQF